MIAVSCIRRSYFFMYQVYVRKPCFFEPFSTSPLSQTKKIFSFLTYLPLYVYLEPPLPRMIFVFPWVFELAGVYRTYWSGCVEVVCPLEFSAHYPRASRFHTQAIFAFTCAFTFYVRVHTSESRDARVMLVLGV